MAEADVPSRPFRPRPQALPRPGRVRRLLTAAALAIVVMACGADDTADPVGGGLRLDPSVFDGEAVTIEGTSFQLGSLADRDLVLWFWAPW